MTVSQIVFLTVVLNSSYHSSTVPSYNWNNIMGIILTRKNLTTPSSNNFRKVIHGRFRSGSLSVHLTPTLTRFFFFWTSFLSVKLSLTQLVCVNPDDHFFYFGHSLPILKMWYFKNGLILRFYHEDW